VIDRVQSVDILRVERRAPERGTGGVKDATDPGASVALLNAVLAFSQGLGPRTIRFRLEGAAQL